MGTLFLVFFLLSYALLKSEALGLTLKRWPTGKRFAFLVNQIFLKISNKNSIILFMQWCKRITLRLTLESQCQLGSPAVDYGRWPGVGPVHHDRLQAWHQGEPCCFNNNQNTNLFQIVKMKNGKRSVAFLHFKFQRAIGFYVLQVLTCYFWRSRNRKTCCYTYI